MRNTERRNFLVVADIHRRLVKEIMIGPNEKKLNVEAIRQVDETIFCMRRQLLDRYPIKDFDVIVARAEGLESLKTAYPEFTGWDGVETTSIEPTS